MSGAAILLLATLDVSVRIAAGVQEVELGRAFPVTVVRRWSSEQTPEEWSDRTLEPLVARWLGTERREIDGQIEETRQYLCHAFQPGDLTKPVRIRVLPTLDPGAPGPVELPGEPLARPAGSFPFLRLLAPLAAALLLVLLLRMRRGPPPVLAVPDDAASPPDPFRKAEQRLQRLRERSPEGREALRAYHDEAAALVRDYVGERFALHARPLTTEQLAEVESIPHRGLLAEILRPCDAVKFARDEPGAADRGRLLDAALTFLRETRS